MKTKLKKEGSELSENIGQLKMHLKAEQQKEVLKRSALYKAGKIKGYTMAEARKRVKQKQAA